MYHNHLRVATFFCQTVAQIARGTNGIEPSWAAINGLFPGQHKRDAGHQKMEELEPGEFGKEANHFREFGTRNSEPNFDWSQQTNHEFRMPSAQ